MDADIQVRLRRVRRRLNISQRELARALGVTGPTVSGYELGKMPNEVRVKQIIGSLYRLAHKRQPRRDLPIY